MNPLIRLLTACAVLALAGWGVSGLVAHQSAFSQRAVSRDTARLLASAWAEQDAGRFPQAFALLQAPRPSASPGDARALKLAVADLQFALAESLLGSSPADALPHLQAALATDRALRPSAVAADLNETGLACDDMGRCAEAVGLLQQALALHRRAGDKDGEAGTLDNLGAAYEHLHQYEAALGCFRPSVTLHQQAGDTDGQAKALQNMGIAYDDERQYTRAIGFYQQSLPLYRQVGDERGAAKALTNIGLAQRDLKGR